MTIIVLNILHLKALSSLNWLAQGSAPRSQAFKGSQSQSQWRRNEFESGLDPEAHTFGAKRQKHFLSIPSTFLAVHVYDEYN